MALKQRKLLSLLIALMLLATLIPVGSASAAASYFTFPSYGTTQDSAKASPVSTQVISKFYGSFSQTVPSTLTYSVQQQVLNSTGVWVDKGTPNTVTNATPVVSGPTNQEFYLQNVSLFTGMNKVTVSTPSGIEGVCYVFYDNAPVINSITLNNGVELSASGPVFVDAANQFFLIKADNAQDVTVDGVNASSYGPSSFSVSNFALKPGLNTLTFVAKSDTRSYTIQRQIVYLDGAGATYNDFLTDGTTSVQIDGKSVVSAGSAGLPKKLTGQIAFPSNSTTDPQMLFTNVQLSKDGAAVFSKALPDNAIPTTQSAPPTYDGAGHKIYNFSIDMSAVTATYWPIADNGSYLFTIEGTYYDGTTTKTFNSHIPFEYKDNSHASITNVQQVYGVDSTSDTGGTAGTFSSQITSLPFYALISVQNNSGAFTPSLSVTQNGKTVTLAENTDYTVLTSRSSNTANAGSRMLKILKLPFQGNMTLNFSILDGGKVDTYPGIPINYNPIPSIAVYGIYDGDNYETNLIPDFSGKLFNFNATEANTLKVTVNGVAKKVSVDTAKGTFTVINNDLTNPNQLKDILNEGPNQIVISGTAQGIPVTTQLTVYYYTNDAPIVRNPFPVPSTYPRSLTDASGKFTSQSATTYNTTEKNADVVVDVSNLEKLIFQRDGSQFFTVNFDSSLNPTPALPMTVSGITVEKETSPYTGYTRIRVVGLPLDLGSNTFVVKGVKGKITSFAPLTIVRGNVPIQLLSPKLPEERVVNQNFLKVVIAAEGADSVLLGKTAMDTVTDNGNKYFVGVVNNLKQGANTIKYTVVQGTQKTNLQFQVTYANTNTVGGQYQSTLAKSGKLTAFNKAVTLTFPKGTMLTPYNNTSKKVDLFDNQNLLLGIADPVSGMTVKTYNHFGNLIPLAGSTFLQSLLSVPEHFGYASNLYWIDAGYSDSSAGYKQYDGMHPYYGDEMNYGTGTNPYSNYNVWLRNQGQYWMKTTQRGTLTLQYDPSIRNAAADKLSIWRLGLDDRNQMKWTNIGGKVNASAHTISTPIDSFGYYAVFYDSVSFDDTQGHDFARDEMELLFARGIMNAKDTGEFGAYDVTTRGEFATILVKALNLPLNYDENNVLFYDVPHSLNASPYWDYRYIETAGNIGITRGVGPHQFAPEDPVSRQEAAIMIATALNLKLGTDLDKSKQALAKIFTDAGNIDTYARTSVEAVYKAKLMTGRSVANPDPKGKPLLMFDPLSKITRAETAKVIVNMMRSKKLL